MLTWFSFLGSQGSRSGELEIDRLPAYADALIGCNNVEESWCARCPRRALHYQGIGGLRCRHFIDRPARSVGGSAATVADVSAARASAMDDAGLDVQVLSLNAQRHPGRKDASLSAALRQ